MALWLLIITLCSIGYSASKHDYIHSTSNGEDLITTLYTSEPTICDPNVQQYSGYLYAGGKNGTNNSYFYWFFESRNNAPNDPLIMWLQGGPGCSSQIANLVENGPCHIINNGSNINDTILNPYSWNSKANLLYVDQPTNTGFSIGSPATKMHEISKDMWIFLKHFYFKFPKYFQNGFFISGESYAGHYIPHIVHYIHKQNKNNPKHKIPLTGFAIGNGLTDPLTQLPFYAQMAYNSSTAINSHFPGLPISQTVYKQMENNIQNCIPFIKTCYDTKNRESCHNATKCFHAIVFHGEVNATGVNKYNLDIKCEMKHLCYDFIAINNWLNIEIIESIIGINTNMTWKECNSHVRHILEPSGASMSNSRQLIKQPLNDGIRGLIYAGDFDFVCNWLGNQAWTLKLKWNGQKSFVNSKMSQWIVNGKIVGEIRQGNNTDFSFVRIKNAGHMVPMDQPEIALELINQFISDTLRSKQNNEMSHENDNMKIIIDVSVTSMVTLWGIVFLSMIGVMCGCWVYKMNV
eukprot:213248_1